MSCVVVSVDRDALPEEMLPMQKAQMRVTYDDEDDFITGIIKRAINLFEKKSGLSISLAEVAWTPNGSDTYTCEGALCPVQPVSEWTAKDAGNVDVTAGYTLSGNTTLYLMPVATMSTPPGPEWFSGVSFTMTVGYEAVNDIEPSALDIILRIGAHLFENRESTTDVNLEEVPLFLDDLLVGHWVPRA